MPFINYGEDLGLPVRVSDRELQKMKRRAEKKKAERDPGTSVFTEYAKKIRALINQLPESSEGIPEKGKLLGRFSISECAYFRSLGAAHEADDERLKATYRKLVIPAEEELIAEAKRRGLKVAYGSSTFGLMALDGLSGPIKVYLFPESLEVKEEKWRYRIV